jgi:hypothetical protein
MYKRLLTFSLLVLLSVFSSCRNDDDDGNNTPDLSGVCSALIDGNNWSANTDRVTVVISDFGSGPLISVNAMRVSDTSYFTFTLPYFYGADTVYTEPTPGTPELRFTQGDIWLGDTATLSINRSNVEGIETYSGTFSGDFEAVIGGDVIVVSGGTFTAKRLL